MDTPEITHLQFLILGTLLHGRRAGRTIRDELRSLGFGKSGPAFYQLMARLEDAELVVGQYTQEVLDGQIIRERVYDLAPAGRTAWTTSKNFYLETIKRFSAEPA